VPEIKQRIWVVKEWSWAARHSLPFQRIPMLLMIHIVLNAIKMLNFFPTKVLGEVTHMKDRHSKNPHIRDETSVKCNKQVTSKQEIRFSLTSIE
jgi:hypothetical protein